MCATRWKTLKITALRDTEGDFRRLIYWSKNLPISCCNSVIQMNKDACQACHRRCMYVPASICMGLAYLWVCLYAPMSLCVHVCLHTNMQVCVCRNLYSHKGNRAEWKLPISPTPHTLSYSHMEALNPQNYSCNCLKGIFLGPRADTWNERCLLSNDVLLTLEWVPDWSGPCTAIDQHYFLSKLLCVSPSPFSEI